MTRMIFEDNGNVGISKLLRFAYNEDYDDEYSLDASKRLWFVAGNGNIIPMLDASYCKEDRYVIYIDVVPDNKKTKNKYNDILRYIDRRKYQNVVVLPIRCIEYYILQYMIEIWEDADLRSLVKKVDYREISTAKSYERYYKQLLEGQEKVCFKKRDIEQERNVFYLVNCFCDYKHIWCKKLSRREKALQLVKYLPLHIVLDGEVSCNAEDITNVVNSLKNDFNKTLDEFIKLKYIPRDAVQWKM